VALAASHHDKGQIPLLEGRMKEGMTLAYVCQNHVCALPTADPAQLAGQLT
jgi:uncharacterized protein YyaL (SSP411 family)